MLRSRPLWRRKPSAALGLVAAARTCAQPALSQLFSVQQQAQFASIAPQAGGEGPLEYYIAAKLALKRIFLGENAAPSPPSENLKNSSPLAQRASAPDVSAPLPDPASPEGLDWSDEAAYRRALGPLGDAKYTEMQQAGTTLSGELSQPTGPESTAKLNVLKDATPEVSSSPAGEVSASAVPRDVSNLNQKGEKGSRRRKGEKGW